MKVHSWSTTTGGQTLQFVWSDPTIYTDPVAEAARLAPLLLARAPIDRVLFFNHAFSGMFAGPHDQLIANGPAWQPHRVWYTGLFNGLAAAQAIPTRIVLDEEGGMSLFQLASCSAQAWAANIYANSAAVARLPAYLQARTPSEYFCLGTPGRQIFITWNQWAKREGLAAIRQALLIPLQLSCDAGRLCRVTNYGDFDGRRVVFDKNGWPVSTGRLGAECSPVLYLEPGNRYVGRAKHYTWNKFIDGLNAVRSAINAGYAVVPWLDTYWGTAPDRAIFGEHIAAHGIETILLWQNTGVGGQVGINYSAPTTARQPIPSGGWPEIPLDADVVVTGSLVTDYTGWTGA